MTLPFMSMQETTDKGDEFKVTAEVLKNSPYDLPWETFEDLL